MSRCAIGLAASPGLAIGPLRRLRLRKIVVERTAKDPERERQRLRAISTARVELQELYQDVEKKSGTSSAAIFRAHAEFLSDPDLIERTEQRIAQGHSAEAVRRLVKGRETAAP